MDAGRQRCASRQRLFFFFFWRERRGGRTPDDPLDHVRHDDRGVFANARREQRAPGKG